MVGVDVRQAQAPVVAVETGLNWLENVRPLQEVEADDRRDQDGQLVTEGWGWGVKRRSRGGGEQLIKPQCKEIPNE